ncbi:nitrile hydratase subunit alpha, partial [Streptomyces sp. NPDC005968]|uniref:nitrile hydratase subunit alpha n=1 Tax=Streptomyces sp. NPDC005968 TaxID=3154574 RepID=UPI00340F5834
TLTRNRRPTSPPTHRSDSGPNTRPRLRDEPLVLPERPAGTEHLTEEELVPLVSRDAMVGVAKVEAP